MTPDDYHAFVDRNIELLAANEQDDAFFALDTYSYKRMSDDKLLDRLRDRPTHRLKSQTSREIFSEDQFDQFGLLCLSEEMSSVLMWSHYANFHQGFSIGFCTETLLEFLRDSRDMYGYHLWASKKCSMWKAYLS